MDGQNGTTQGGALGKSNPNPAERGAGVPRRVGEPLRDAAGNALGLLAVAGSSQGLVIVGLAAVLGLFVGGHLGARHVTSAYEDERRKRQAQREEKGGVK